MRMRFRLFAAALLAAVSLPGLASAQVPGMGKQERFEDWTVFCPANTDCTAMFSGAGVRLLVGPNAADGELRVAVLVAANADASRPVVTLLPGPDPDAGARRILMNIRSCTSGFCKALASAETAPQVVELFRTSRRGRVVYVVKEGQTVASTVSFAGFADALAEIEAHTAQAGAVGDDGQ
jgi:invasion protein IalB